MQRNHDSGLTDRRSIPAGSSVGTSIARSYSMNLMLEPKIVIIVTLNYKGDSKLIYNRAEHGTSFHPHQQLCNNKKNLLITYHRWPLWES